MDEHGQGVGIEITILVVGALALALLAGMGWQDLRTIDRTAAWEELVNGVARDVTRSHLWLEEHLAGDRLVEVDQAVRAPLARARAACGVLQRGGTHDGLRVSRLPAGAADPDALCGALDGLRDLTERRLTARGVAGDRLDAAYDARFREVEVRADGLHGVVDDVVDRGRRQLLARAGGLGVVVLAVTGVAAAVVRRWRRRLEAAAARDRSLLEASGDAIFGLDAQGRVVVANPAAAELTGVGIDELEGRDLGELIEECEGRPCEECPTLRALTGGGATRDREGTIRHRDGTETVVESSTTPVTGGDGTILGAVKIARDVTERREAEAALRESHRRLVEAEEIAGLGSFEWDPATDEVVWSEGLYHMTGLSPETFTPTFEGWLETLHPDDRETAVTTVREAMESCSDYELDHRVVTADGEVQEWHSVGRMVTGEQGELVRVVGTARDVTEERRVERLKDEFTSVVSHELRTPLTSVHGALQLLDTAVVAELPDRIGRLVRIAAQNTDRLIRLVNDILDVERLASGRIELQPVETEVDALVDEAVTAMTGMAERDGVTLEVDGRGGAWVRADRDRMLQVLTNLLSNAVKFSEPGGTVTVSTRRHDDEVVVEVADQGRGIPPDQLEAVFGRFHQVDTSDARERGTGLGLSISRSIVERHGGSIRAESDGLGHGARLSFTLPAVPAGGVVGEDAGSPVVGAPGAEDPEGRCGAESPRILVCDDDRRDRAGIVALLRGAGFEVAEVAGGRECLRVAEADPPDVIVMDLLMPDLDGWDTITRLSEEPATAGIPVVVLSAVAPGEDTPLGDEIVAWLTKAASRDELVGTVRRVAAGPPPRLLIVEDDRGLARVLGELFDTGDLQIVHAVTSAAAVAACEQAPPDLVLLDLELPDAHGLTVVDWLRERERLRCTPIVVYTATDLTAAERRRLGSAPVLTKSRVGLAEVEQRVFEVLGRVAGAGPAVAGEAGRG